MRGIERGREEDVYEREKKCVCVRERGTERERKTINNGKLIFLKYNIEFAIRVYTNELI